MGEGEFGIRNSEFHRTLPRTEERQICCILHPASCICPAPAPCPRTLHPALASRWAASPLDSTLFRGIRGSSPGCTLKVWTNSGEGLRSPVTRAEPVREGGLSMKLSGGSMRMAFRVGRGAVVLALVVLATPSPLPKRPMWWCSTRRRGSSARSRTSSRVSWSSHRPGKNHLHQVGLCLVPYVVGFLRGL